MAALSGPQTKAPGFAGGYLLVLCGGVAVICVLFCIAVTPVARRFEVMAVQYAIVRTIQLVEVAKHLDEAAKAESQIVTHIAGVEYHIPADYLRYVAVKPKEYDINLLTNAIYPEMRPINPQQWGDKRTGTKNTANHSCYGFQIDNVSGVSVQSNKRENIQSTSPGRRTVRPL
jgi:hypothetical protein